MVIYQIFLLQQQLQLKLNLEMNIAFTVVVLDLNLIIPTEQLKLLIIMELLVHQSIIQLVDGTGLVIGRLMVQSYLGLMQHILLEHLLSVGQPFTAQD